MTGADIIGALVLEDARIAELVARASIKNGALPEKVVLPALLLRVTSSVEEQRLKRGQMVRTIDRVSVTVRAANYADQVAIIRMLRSCCAGRTGDVAGGKSVSILTAGAGPDLRGPGNSFEQTQDFRVSFDAPA